MIVVSGVWISTQVLTYFWHGRNSEDIIHISCSWRVLAWLYLLKFMTQLMMTRQTTLSLHCSSVMAWYPSSAISISRYLVAGGERGGDTPHSLTWPLPPRHPRQSDSCSPVLAELTSLTQQCSLVLACRLAGRQSWQPTSPGYSFTSDSLSRETMLLL